MVFLPEFDDVLEIHNELVEVFRNDADPISPPGPRDVNLIYSACMRPQTSLGGIEKYESEFSKLAALFHSLCQNHAFHNGNKRTALVTLIAYLYRNNRIFSYDLSDDEIYEMTVSVANGSFLNHLDRLSPDSAVSAIESWLSANTISRNVAPSDMRVTEFKKKCGALGCKVRETKDGSISISHNSKSVRIGGGTRQIAGAVARKYLSVLDLSFDKTGQTFLEFQNVEDSERNELYRYMNVLRRLAKI